jgi:hypothetical protein
MTYYIFTPDTRDLSPIENILIDLDGDFWILYEDQFLVLHPQECPLLDDIIGDDDRQCEYIYN